MWFAFAQGFALGGSLIIAIGAQNAYVIKLGARGGPVYLSATICFLSDAMLIALGSAGVGTLIASDPMLRSIAAWGGAAFLGVYGVKAGLAAWRATTGMDLEGDAGTRGAWNAVMTTLAFTYLNPHVYLDTVVLVGGLAAQFEAAPRTAFAVGAISASLVWFYGLALAAKRAQPFFRSVTGARLLEGTICVVMLTIAVSLVVGEVS